MNMSAKSSLFPFANFDVEPRRPTSISETVLALSSGLHDSIHQALGPGPSRVAALGIYASESLASGIEEALALGISTRAALTVVDEIQAGFDIATSDHPAWALGTSATQMSSVAGILAESILDHSMLHIVFEDATTTWSVMEGLAGLHSNNILGGFAEDLGNLIGSNLTDVWGMFGTMDQYAWVTEVDAWGRAISEASKSFTMEAIVVSEDELRTIRLDDESFE